ncbi:hypothetical protein GE061_015842 [Apolygus lucorum]|uniref:RNA-directed DNA polymerase n=1 Tax=Apolygus lucorum TaxID=248454 RepID=A0A8S9XPY6_APOLU|nr:hypothetical protein GE061_015842 [Apolygus lucorum]
MAAPTKLPQYDPSLPSVWIAQVRLACANEDLKTEPEQFRRAFLALDVKTAELVADIDASSPTAFTSLCNRLLQAHGPRDGSDLSSILQNNSLDGSSAAAHARLLRRKLPTDTPASILRSIFLRALPPDIRLNVAVSTETDIDKLAAIADRLLPLRDNSSSTAATALQSTSTYSSDDNGDSADDATHIASAANRTRTFKKPSQIPSSRQRSSQMPSSRPRNFARRRIMPQQREQQYPPDRRSPYCYYHQRWGPSAIYCQSPCSWRQQMPTGNANARSPRCDLSILPNNHLNRRRETPSSTLLAANGSKITTYGSQTATVHLPKLPPYEWTFTVANVSTAILGADFLSHYGLLVDLQNLRLIDSASQSFLPGHCLIASPQESYCSAACAPPRFQRLLDAYEPSSHPKSAPVYHHIVTTGPPCHAKQRRLAPHLYNQTKAHFNEMLRSGIVRPSNSPWSSPLHVVLKQNGDIRPVRDYRDLNRATTPDRYPIGHLHDFTLALHGSTIFSTFDLSRAFFHCRIAPEDIKKTAILTPFGLYEFTRMNYGLRNAPQTWQRYMDCILRDLPFAYVYLDDILIGSPDAETHFHHVSRLLHVLASFGLSINKAKCQLARSQVKFLGHLVDKDGIKPLPSKTALIRNFPLPQSVNDLRTFLGLINFYRRAIPHAAHSLMHLTKLLPSNPRKNDKRPISWPPDALHHFEKAKQLLESSVQLAHPHPSAQLILHTDASNFAVGAALHYQHNGTLFPLGFFSKALSPAQRNYSTFDKELLAIYLAIIHFRQTIEGRPLTISTDHKPLTTALTSLTDTMPPIRLRHLRFISEFTSDIIYRPGASNLSADLFSRINHTSAVSIVPPTAIRDAQLNDPHIENMNLTPVTRDGITLLCDMSDSSPRPYIPATLRPDIFKMTHGLSHPGIKATMALLRGRFYWPNMFTSIKTMTRACPSCNRAKVTRHIRAPLDRFDDISPLPPRQILSNTSTINPPRPHLPRTFSVATQRTSSPTPSLLPAYIPSLRSPKPSRQRRYFEDTKTKFKTKINISAAAAATPLPIPPYRHAAVSPATSSLLPLHRRHLRYITRTHRHQQLDLQSMPSGP